VKLSRFFTIGAFILLAVNSREGFAHGRGYWRVAPPPGFSLYFGFPYGYPRYYRPYPYPPYYPYYPPAYPVPAPPPVYIEPHRRNPAYGSRYWFYCSSSGSYYPRVTACPEGWQTIRPYPDGRVPGYWYYCDEPAGYYPYIRQCYRPWRQVMP
jgi:hypothetical protein